MRTERFILENDSGTLQGSVREGGIATVDSLVITQRRQGHGSAFYRELEQKAHTYHCTHVVIEIHKTNTVGQAFWQQHGFVYNEAACEDYDEYVKALPASRPFAPKPENFATSCLYDGTKMRDGATSMAALKDPDHATQGH